jgi:hypothetical protein
MIPPNAMALVKELHAAYVEGSGQKIVFNMARENNWREWCTWGNWAWTCEDLTRVITYLLEQIRLGKRNMGALKFSNLIGFPDKFEEDLQLALHSKHERRSPASGRSDAANSQGRYR